VSLSKSVVEDAALSWFRELGYTVAHAPHLAPGEIAAERNSFSDVVLSARLRNAIAQLNPNIPSEACEEAFRKGLRLETPSLLGNNRRFHQILRDGVEVEYRRDDGSIAGDRGVEYYSIRGITALRDL
jgi:type I restriction enzyme, R subunit